MTPPLPIICILGAEGIVLTSSPRLPRHETTALDCRCFPDDSALEQILIAHVPHVIVSIGPRANFPKLAATPHDIRRRWLHVDRAENLAELGRRVFERYLAVSLNPTQDEPLVSVFTPTFRSGARFLSALASMRAQTWTNWEWVIWDDSDDDGRTHAMLAAHARTDHRMHVLRGEAHSGVIGAVKYLACANTRGDLLVELDHDDELTPDALERIVAASRLYPGAGFFYSDFAEIDASGVSLRYPDGWGSGFGSYRDEMFQGQKIWVANAPPINPKTIRALVSCPNHVRAWRRDTYFAVGGHNRRLHVADDFDLLIRTFLATRMVRIPKLCYLQFRDASTTQSVRNADIQRHVRALREYYDRVIHDRFTALGIGDWVWDAAAGRSDMTRPNPARATAASLVAAA